MVLQVVTSSVVLAEQHLRPCTVAVTQVRRWSNLPLASLTFQAVLHLADLRGMPSQLLTARAITPWFLNLRRAPTRPWWRWAAASSSSR